MSRFYKRLIFGLIAFVITVAIGPLGLSLRGGRKERNHFEEYAPRLLHEIRVEMKAFHRKHKYYPDRAGLPPRVVERADVMSRRWVYDTDGSWYALGVADGEWTKEGHVKAGSHIYLVSAEGVWRLTHAGGPFPEVEDFEVGMKIPNPQFGP